MTDFKLRGDYITLGQLLKAENLVEDGAMAKEVIKEGLAKVNGEVDTRRGKKLYDGDVFEYDGKQVKVTGSCM